MTQRGKILLTGGAGYIGSHVNQALHRLGWDTVLVDDLSTGHVELARWGVLEVGSLLDHDFLAGVFSRHGIEAVLHFAGLTSVEDSVSRPELYQRVNVHGTQLLLAAMKNAGVRNMVLSSSAAVYGNPAIIPITEDEPCGPLSPYGHTKLDAERLMLESGEWGLRHVSLRYFNAAGADEGALIGEWHDCETHLIPLVMDVALGRRECIHVFGDDYETADGTCVRDYVHVSDLADAHVRALDHTLGDGASSLFNLGSGGGSSVREVIDAVQEVTGRPVETRIAPRRPGDTPTLVADSTRARRELGWRPERESLRTIVEDAWRWHRKLRESVDG